MRKSNVIVFQICVVAVVAMFNAPLALCIGWASVFVISRIYR